MRLIEPVIAGSPRAKRYPARAATRSPDTAAGWQIARPLVRVAQLAETFRGGEEFVPLPEDGPIELVTLARSFNTMAREITRASPGARTGIAYSLQHPTRVRLR